MESVNGWIEVMQESDAVEGGKFHGRNLPQVQITGTIRALTPERLEATTLEAVRDGSGELRIRPVWPGDKRRSREGCAIQWLIDRWMD